MSPIQAVRSITGTGTCLQRGVALPGGWLPGLLIAALTASAAAGPVRGNPPADERAGRVPSVVGQWDGPYTWPVVAIHAFMMPSGKVLHFDFPGSPGWDGAWLWDPGTWQFTAVPLNRPLFCSGHSFLPDGRLLVTGGNGPAPPGEFRGIKDTHLFDSFSETWTRVQDMADGRWYPTNVTLGDGRVLVVSGLDELTGAGNTDVEVYDPGSGAGWQLVAQEGLPLYPRMHLLSSGDVFYSGPTQVTGTYQVGAWSWSGIVSNNYGDRWDTISVLLPPGPDKVMIIGGQNGVEVTNTVEIIDLAGPAPAWRYTQPMSSPRMHANGVILPDGKLLVVGGHSTLHDEGGGGPPPTPVYAAEMFDPATETWSVMASMLRPRMYHSTANLLPDGRVLVGGSDGELTTEIYSPPYLFRGPPPVIDTAPTQIAYAKTFQIQSPNAADIRSIALIRLSSVTHSVDMDQRYVALQFNQPPANPGLLVASAPADPNLAPPGPYMLFLLDSNEVPSTAAMVLLGGTAAAIPTVSGWGMMVITLLVLTAAGVILGRRRPRATKAGA